MDDDTQRQTSPSTPQPGNISASQFTGLVTVLQQIGRNQVALQNVLSGLIGQLSPTYAVANWTPGLAFGGSAVGIAGTFAGTYTQTGRDLFCYFAITLSSKGAAVGSATITGLPQTSGSLSAAVGAGGIITSSANMSGLTAAPVLINVPGSGTTASLLQQAAAATAAITDARFTNTSTLYGYFQYPNA